MHSIGQTTTFHCNLAKLATKLRTFLHTNTGNIAGCHLYKMRTGQTGETENSANHSVLVLCLQRSATASRRDQPIPKVMSSLESQLTTVTSVMFWMTIEEKRHY